VNCGKQVTPQLPRFDRHRCYFWQTAGLPGRFGTWTAIPHAPWDRTVISRSG